MRVSSSGIPRCSRGYRPDSRPGPARTRSAIGCPRTPSCRCSPGRRECATWRAACSLARGPSLAAPTGDLDPAQQPVARLVHNKPVICEPERRRARGGRAEWPRQRRRAALVRLPDGQLGILTDHDLRDRVVAGGVGVDAPVTEVMSFPAFTVTPERLGAEVMLEMLDRDIRHVPVVWPHGEVLGVLSDRDLLAAETRAPFALRRAIDDADDVDGLRRAAGQLRPAVIALNDAEYPPAQIASIIAVVTDALTRRLMEFAVDELGAPPCPVSWLALGSLGRREVVPSSDVDSALVWDGARRGAGAVHARPRRPRGGRADGERLRRRHPRATAAAAALRSLVRGLAGADPQLDRAPGSRQGAGLSVAAVRRPLRPRDRDARDPLDELRQAWHRPTAASPHAAACSRAPATHGIPAVSHLATRLRRRSLRRAPGPARHQGWWPASRLSASPAMRAWRPACAPPPLASA